MWKCVSMRPPLRWMRSADQSICEAAITCRVTAAPGCVRARTRGSAASTPPRKTAACTWRCTVWTWPAQAYGEIVSAQKTASAHWPRISQVKMRSVFR